MSRLPWGHKPRKCVYCGGSGPRTQVLGGFAHKYCIPKAERFNQGGTSPKPKPALAKAYGDCRCPCHRRPMKHCFPCCGQSRERERIAAVERGKVRG